MSRSRAHGFPEKPGAARYAHMRKRAPASPSRPAPRAEACHARSRAPSESPRPNSRTACNVPRRRPASLVDADARGEEKRDTNIHGLAAIGHGDITGSAAAVMTSPRQGPNPRLPRLAGRCAITASALLQYGMSGRCSSRACSTACGRPPRARPSPLARYRAWPRVRIPRAGRSMAICSPARRAWRMPLADLEAPGMLRDRA